jgi:hypothetical protein
MQLTTVLTLLFCAAILAIIAQPRDDAAMRAFFAPDDCPTPCFAGIRPGVTTYGDALAILSAHPWVGQIDRTQDGLAWAWNGQQPDFANSFGSNFVLGHIDFAAGIVRTIRVQTTTRWAEFYFLFGSPDRAGYRIVSTVSSYYRIFDGAYA